MATVAGTAPAYRFRPFTRDDLPMAARWLRSPEVVRWWGEPGKELALLTADLDEPAMRQWIVECEGRPFAYAQAYPSAAWPQSHLKHLPDGTRMIDAFIGEPAMLGCGHGGAFLRRLAENLLAEGAPAVAIDPDCGNVRARRAYARAGFVEEKMVETEEGCVAVMLFR
ncbi:MAG TPA: GNAT family N-acetyltransferase [Acetobacteraceae bacterium]|nr:GNAT family N-acetyltransferase [Acetobacteraceae bacterium]